jgi:hypothetical protein
MTEVVERVNLLEEALTKLAYAQFNLHIEVDRLILEGQASRERSEREMADFKAEMRASRERSEREMADFKAEMQASRERSEREMTDFKAEMADFKAEMRASRERSEREMADFKAEMADFKAEMRADRRQMNKRWGEIANRLGTIVEDIVLPNIPRIAREHFGAGQLEFIGARIHKQHPTEPDRMREFDVIAAWPGAVLLNETKGGAMRPEYLTSFAAFINSGDFFGFFPEYAGRRLIPVFSALALAESDIRYLTRERIYALTMGEETMDLVNLAEVGQPQ